MRHQKSPQLSTLQRASFQSATSNTLLGLPDESLTMRISTQAMMKAGWTALVKMAQMKSKRCKSRKRLSWILIFLDKQDLNPAMARYAILTIRWIFILTKVDVRAQSTGLHVFASQSVETIRLPASCCRPPQQDALNHFLTIQHRHDNPPMATLAQQSVRNSIKCPHSPLERRISHCSARLRSIDTIRDQRKPSGTTTTQPNQAYTCLYQHELWQGRPSWCLLRTRRLRGGREV